MFDLAQTIAAAIEKQNAIAQAYAKAQAQMGDQTLPGLAQRCDDAQHRLSDLQQAVQQTAGSAHKDVTDLLSTAMASLVNVIDVVDAHFKEDGELDQSGKTTLQEMTKRFEAVEARADECGNALGKIHEDGQNLSSTLITPLNTDIMNQVQQARSMLPDFQQQKAKLEVEMSVNESRLRNGQDTVNRLQGIVDNPVTAAVVYVSSPFAWLGDKITGGNADFDQNIKMLEKARSDLENIRNEGTTIQRHLQEATARIQVLQDQERQAVQLLQGCQSLQPRAVNMAHVTEQFLGALIHIKGKATVLRKQAGEVEASASTTNKTADTKADFARGILNIVNEATSDFAIKTVFQSVMQELLKQWTTDGEGMPNRLKKTYDDVQAKVDQVKEGSEDREWNDAVNATQQN